MADNIINVRIKDRSDMEANWTSKNPVLLKGERAITDGTGKYKIGDGKNTWGALPYYEAMTSSDRTKLNGIESGANKTTVDSSLSSSSTNPVQNKVVNSALAGKSNTNHTHDDRYYTESEIDSKLDGKANSSHTHNYAGSSSAGGSANSAVKLDTTTSGSATQPVYFSEGKPVACTYTLGKSVPSNAVFTDTNTWRPLGTGADQACAGNDSRLSNARPASDVYAWAKESTKPAYTWNEIGSKPSTFTPASHGHNMISMYASNTINSIKNDTTAKWGSYNDSIHFYSNSNQLTDQPSQYGFLHNISNSAAEVHQVWYEQASGSVYHRGGNGSGWSGSWKRFLDTGNYNSYVPTKTGGGASGTWGINITGKATTADTADVANSVAWGNVSGKPVAFSPSAHSHVVCQSTEPSGQNNGDLWFKEE